MLMVWIEGKELVRRVLVHGTHNIRDGAKVSFRIKGEERAFLQGAAEVVEHEEILAGSMRSGEVAVVVSGPVYAAGTTLEAHADEVPDPLGLPRAEKVLYCKAQKDRATAYLKAGRFREAVKKWDEVAKFLELHVLAGSEEDSSKADARAVLEACLLNLSLA